MGRKGLWLVQAVHRRRENFTATAPRPPPPAAAQVALPNTMQGTRFHESSLPKSGFGGSRIHLALSPSDVAESIASEDMLDSDLCENGSVVKCLL